MSLFSDIFEAIFGRPDSIETILDKRLKEQSEKLDWRHSVVDLLKLLKLDSSLESRRKLAKELGYEGDVTDSDDTNKWLHGQVMDRLKRTGGRIPRELM